MAYGMTDEQTMMVRRFDASLPPLTRRLRRQERWTCNVMEFFRLVGRDELADLASRVAHGIETQAMFQ